MPRRAGPLPSCASAVVAALVVAAAAGCTGERISSELEFQAVGACSAAIEERLGEDLPPGWQYLKEERDGEAFMKAWAPARDTESTPPDFTCTVVPDQKAPQGVRVVRLNEGAHRS